MFHTLFNVLGVAIMTPMIGVLIRLLLCLVPEKEPDVSQPRYLSDAVLELPDTSIRAIRDEVVHLYDNAVDLMAVGLGVTGDAIRSDMPVAEVVAMPQPAEAPDLDGLYQRRVKSLYSAITEFAARAEADFLPEQAQSLHLLRAIARDIVIATKGVKHLNKNLRRYSRSANEDIAAHYQREKSLIVGVLRALETLTADVETGRDELDEILASAAANNVVENGELDRLIRERRITPEMATSVINDAQYREDVLNALIDTAMVAMKNRSAIDRIEA